MKQKFLNWFCPPEIRYFIIGILFVSILGTLGHFFYEWSGNNWLVGVLCPINESTMEHLKLLFFPMMLYTIFLTIKFPKNLYIAPAMLLGTFWGLVLIPVLFYGYPLFLERNISVLDISTFYISVVSSAILIRKMIKSRDIKVFSDFIVSLSLLIFILFFVYTLHQQTQL